MDLRMLDTGNGGDLIRLGEDLATTSGLETAVYLSLFGGADWWANALTDDRQERYQSRTEQTLREVALNSAGRIRIEQAVLEDLAWCNDIPGSKPAVAVAIAGPDRATITITIAGQQFGLQWSPIDEQLTYTA